VDKIHTLEGTAILDSVKVSGIEITIPYLLIGRTPNGDMGQSLNSWFRLFLNKKIKITVEES